MKTTIDIPENELRDAMRFTRAATTREAVVKVLEEFNRRRRMAELVKYAGTFSDRRQTRARRSPTICWLSSSAWPRGRRARRCWPDSTADGGSP